MPLRINVGGNFRPVIGAWIRFQNSWRRLNGIWVRAGGSWRKTYSPEMDIGPIGTTRYNVNLYNEYVEYTGDRSGSPIGFKFRILCNIGSNSTTLPSLDCSTIPVGSNIIIENLATIAGRGGDGGSAATADRSNGFVTDGQSGGPAVRLSAGSQYVIENRGVIGGGGGGGGGNSGVICGGCGWSICCPGYAASGGGGTGLPNGNPGPCSGRNCAVYPLAYCSPNGACGYFCYYAGGIGGGYGQAGYTLPGCGGCSSGNFCTCCLSWPGFRRGANGGAGAAIQWNGGIATIINTGFIYGTYLS